ncbi:hypothetical protein [Croceimicrobium sp.]|uniref:hypothetical protein n=1 Tax=Croceimicrobium sp. TaxID=2828340 RepID=UPI003BAD6660
MPKSPLVILLFSIGCLFSGLAQKTQFFYLDSSDSTKNSALLILPEKPVIKGLLIRDYTHLPSLESLKESPYQWRDLALNSGLAILYTSSTQVFPELYLKDRGLEVLDSLLGKVLATYSIPENALFIGGISASGTRALRYVQYCAAGKSNFDIRMRGAFAVDAPLDMERFYQSVHWNKNKFKAGMLWEANYMQDYYAREMGCSPEECPKRYHSASVHSYRDSSCSQAQLLMGSSVLLIHEPDMDWWSNERGASYFDINSFDLVGLHTCLLNEAHSDLEIICTSGKGFDKEGNRNCHSWTIVDENYLIEWILDRCESP